MHCFNHRNQPAAAICAGCSKGICADCFAPGVEFSSCNKEVCLGFAKKSRQIINAYNMETGNQIIKKSHVSVSIVGLMLFLMGTLFYSIDSKIAILFIVFGAVLFIYNVYSFITKKHKLFQT